MEILIGADIVPINSNIQLFEEGNIKELFSDSLIEKLEKADIRIFNLETPLTDEVSPIKKCGPNLVASTKSINGIKKLNPSFLTLANNHILDHGKQGLKSTMEVLKRNNILFSGASMNLIEAQKTFILEKKGIKVGIYCCTEHEFSIAKRDEYGANPYDPLESFDAVYNLKKKCDYLIVLYHGGKEYYRYPTPELQKVFRKFAEKGANLVIAQHTHCIGCFEEYNDALLLYGQGNFHFTKYHNEFWDSSILVSVNIEKNLEPKIDYIPLKVDNNCVILAEESSSCKIMNEFFERSEQIKSDNFVLEQFDKYTELQGTNYAKVIRGETGIIRRLQLKLNKKSFDYHYKNKRIYALLNYIECETHREIVINELKRLLKK
ncbi:MAG: CapA family protein [Thomasclavelia sp.]